MMRVKGSVSDLARKGGGGARGEEQHYIDLDH